jgi:hypothetical protein
MIENMNYLYYSLYVFYTKIIKVQKDWRPIYSVTGIITLIPTTFLVVPIYDAFDEVYLHISDGLSSWIIVFIYLLIDRQIYKVYNEKEKTIIRDMSHLPVKKKVLIHVLSSALVLLTFGMWFSTHWLSDITDYIKLIIQ